jgi:DNA-binding SARP family transcriptional activator
MTEIRIELFGGFRVIVGGSEITEEAWRQRKPAALVKLLALAPRHRLHREQAMDALWPDLPPASAAANLRKALHNARRTTDEGAIVSLGELLSLPAEAWVDVDSFRAVADRARRGGDADAYAEVVALYRDGLLPDDRYEEWVIPIQDELRAADDPDEQQRAAEDVDDRDPSLRRGRMMRGGQIADNEGGC